MDNTGPGSLGGTFGGHPLSCEAALAAIQAIEELALNDRAFALGEVFRKRASSWQRRFRSVGDVRGLGAMQAMELVRGDGSNVPDAELTKQITRYCYEHGVILVTAGSYGNIIRLLMPLVMSDAEMEEALDVVEAALSEACQVEPAVNAETPVAVA
jgi:4-aminobutyrate aminotransferase/(S)-3-amino-2-methylpropionate transaminase